MLPEVVPCLASPFFPLSEVLKGDEYDARPAATCVHKIAA
jgi:hypothetical protein